MSAVAIYDRTKESSTTTGTGSFTVAGAETGGFVTINSVVGSGNSFYYCVQNTSANEWEVGVGTSTNATTFSRDTVLASSNAGSAVNFSAGTKDCFITAPAALLAPLTTTGDVLYLASTGRPTRLAIGSASQALTVSAGLPAWATLGVAGGGTGIATVAANGIVYGNGTGALQALAVNSTTTNKFLTQSSSNAPAWATLVTGDVPAAALTKVDDTNVTLTLGGTPTSALLVATSLTLGWTGTLAVARGGSGAATFTANGVIYGNTASAFQVTAAGTNNQVLCGNTSAAPAFRALTYADMPLTTLGVFTPLDNQPPAAVYAVLGNRNNHATLEYDNSTNWDGIFEGVLDRAYAGGNVVVTLAWAALSGTSGNVGWKGQFERLNAANHNLDTDAFATAQSSSADACNGTNGKLTVSTITFTSSQIDGVVAGDAFRLKITRDTTVASNLAARAQLISVELKG